MGRVCGWFQIQVPMGTKIYLSRTILTYIIVLFIKYKYYYKQNNNIQNITIFTYTIALFVKYKYYYK